MNAHPLADLAIINCTALVDTTTTPATFVHGATITIAGGVITGLGVGVDTPTDAATVIDASGQVAMPGLINTHCHAAMNLLRGAAEDVRVSEWFNDYIWPMEVNVGADDVYVGTLAAIAEMIECGVTTFADHYFFMDRAGQAVQDTGIRANLGSAFFSSQGPDGLAASIDFAERWNGRAAGLITTSIAPHAPYTVSDSDLRAAADAARRLGVRVHTHAAEDIAQTNLSVADRGITPIQVLADTGVLDAGVIIAHGNGIIDSDIDLLGAHADRVGVTHGPKGYLKFALGPLTPISGLLAAGVPVGYCTDGVASNNSHDILESMRIAAIMQKQLAGDGRWFTSAQALNLAGPGSAAVAGLGGQIGELQVGFGADIILVDVSGLHVQPVHDLAAALVYSVRASDVQTTIVDGQVLMRDRQLLTIDRAGLLAEVAGRAAALTDRSHGRTIQNYNAS